MKTIRKKERGQALIIITFAAIGIFAVVGLAIDGSAQFSDRRHAQNAADTAALAGALAKANSHRNADDSATTWAKLVNAAMDRASANGYTSDLVTNTVSVYNPPVSGIYSNCSDVHFNCTNYVQVIIDSTVNTTFARVIGIDQVHNHVEAVASTVAAQEHFNFDGNVIVALSPTGCALIAAGTTDVTINGGGIYSNSDASCSFKKTTCSGVVDINVSGGAGSVTSVGGAQINTGCWDPAHATLNPGGSTQLPFPPLYDELSEPAVCSQTADLSSNYSVDNSTKIATLQPGHYSALPVHTSWKGMILNPGVYCINTALTVNSTESLKIKTGVTGGVLLYFKPGGYVSINGQADINIKGIDQANVDSDSNLTPYKGYLMYIAPNYSLATPPTCKINGGSTSLYQGTIYAPYCNLQINGGSGMVMRSQVIGYTVDMSGASGVTIDYISAPKTEWPIETQVGLSN